MKRFYAVLFGLLLIASSLLFNACDFNSSPSITAGTPKATSSVDPFDDIESDQINLDAISQPFEGLEAKLRANESATFGGMYDQGPQWIIYFTSNGDQTIRKYLPDESMFQVKIRQSTFTISELETTQKNAVNTFTAAGITSSSDIDLLMQRVILYVKSTDLAKANSLKANLPYYVDILTNEQKPTAEPWLQ